MLASRSAGSRTSPPSRLIAHAGKVDAAVGVCSFQRHAVAGSMSSSFGSVRGCMRFVLCGLCGQAFIASYMITNRVCSSLGLFFLRLLAVV